ncbi:MAG: deoxyguanosinetriphosphate triphosphohydrolase [Faecalibacterium sp.]|nr:deoxyguanosinetriphosphate triphosphohydrolase [Ruminococcus sp.]MCM1391432.1 deoxyguanosinetriphosphate triphosphohydrolase [Ruminococcus sp.]MCM1485106.1 deoxyguanosinetriphosphate triphosphohydrolase [Faecalibacterium sp.]
MDEIRLRTLEIERKTISKYGMLCENTKGRLTDEKECSIRTAYQRDRDRIIHCNAFRRLKHKTQVFLSPDSDHYRTRLTHTLEVSQIARTIAAALLLNENLTEAIALAHDLGHTPFGHAGERALNEVYPGGFKHYEQSLRVVDVIENDGKGLNLTYEVRDGILCHTRGKEADTLEGRIVKLADRIAYINHDIDDAIRGGIISERGLPIEARKVLGESKSERINTLVTSAIRNTDSEIHLDSDVQAAFDILHEFMFDRVYTNPICKGEEGKAQAMVQKIYSFFAAHPDELPNEYISIAWKEGAERAACDYIAGMTDGFALKTFSDLFIPSGWNRF